MIQVALTKDSEDFNSQGSSGVKFEYESQYVMG